MVDLVPKSTGKFESNSLMDSFLIGAIKAVEERALMPIIGNGSLKSGIVKGIGGAVIQSAISGKAGKLIGSAMAIDAVEDVVQALLVPALAGGSSTGSQVDNW